MALNVIVKEAFEHHQWQGLTHILNMLQREGQKYCKIYDPDAFACPSSREPMPTQRNPNRAMRVKHRLNQYVLPAVDSK